LEGNQGVRSTPHKEAVAICNLYRVRKSVAEVADLFRAPIPAAAPNVPDEVYPGYPGLVVRDLDGSRVLGG
jgi:hypothetical protein